MGHWEQIGAERHRAAPVSSWRKLAAGLLIASGTVLAYGLVFLQLWKLF
ncbi:hypothetical protein [Hyphomicrobium sp.]|nr:hypothetical protein [Hyphomicrobium sp.]